MQREERKLRRKKVQNHKLGVIVPYRDRPQQLKRFVSHMEDYLKDIEYEIFIVEQSDDKPFNRGKLP
jgi:DNA-binding LacI/PurR family transcriptional regulator